MSRPIIDRLLPIPENSGFKMEGYFVWCGSMIRVGDQYHLFASRWPEGTGSDPNHYKKILDGYTDHSEIVRATADKPTGPFEFQEVVLAGRGGDYWDGKSCHGAKIVKNGNRFVLYYQAIACNSQRRKIGYAWADSIEGPWYRCRKEIPLTDDANNPALCIHSDGSVLLAYRTQKLEMRVATADAVDGDYTTIAENIFPGGKMEDPDLYIADGQYHMIMEDAGGVLTGSVKHGGHLVSEDGIQWVPYEPKKAYSHDLTFTDGTSITATRRERPDMFNDREGMKGQGHPTHLITGVLYQGHSWCVVQEIASE